MSDDARDLLVYGKAAAQANSRDEARNYLEWVLRTDADFDQQADAWYWLSYITDDPKQKRACLENVLALNPRYPEALRDMALLDGRLKKSDMHDPRFPVAPVTPSAHLTPAETESYKCPQCGARMTATGPEGALVCGFCGYRPDTGQSDGHPSGMGEQDWIAAIYAKQGHRWELPTERTFHCAECGASVFLPPSQVSASCPFCGVPYVAQAVEERELIEPNGVAPFTYGAGEAFSAIAGWIHSHKLAPGSPATQPTQTAPRPIFIPFWTFDVEGDISWEGMQTSIEYRRPVRVPTGGTVPLYYDDILVPATRSLPTELLSKLKYDNNLLVPYSPDLLANWPSEIYSLSVADASLEAREYACKSPTTQALISTSVSVAGNIQELHVESPQIRVISYKLLLLPVWFGAYTHEGQTYRVVANGQSRVVEGETPERPLRRFIEGLFE